MYLYLYPYRRQTKSSIFMRYCGVVRCGAWREDVDKNKMDNHLPYKLELENMPAIKEGKIKTAFTKGGREWEKERECSCWQCECEREAVSFIQLVRFLACLPSCLPACLTYLVRELASLILLEQQPPPHRFPRTPHSHDTHCSLCHIYIYVFMWFPS